MSFPLIRAIAGQTWFIDPAYVEQITPFLVGLLNGHAPEWSHKDNLSIHMVSGAQPQAYDANKASDIPPGSIAIVRISGPLMKEDQFCGPSGTASIQRQLKALDANPNVEGIVLQISSPGGTVDGTEDFARTVKGLTKATVAYADGLMASAAMWIGSAANHIMVNGNTAMVGSIGTMTGWADLRPVLEKAGVKFHSIKADASIDKNADFEKASQGDYEGYRKNVLNPLNDAFTGSIKENRQGKLNLEKENVLTGKMYIGKQAIKAGLADSMGNIDDAVAMARKISKSKNPSKMKMTEKYPRLTAVATIDANAELLENGSVELTATELAAIEQSMADANADFSNLTTAQAALATAQADLATAQSSLASEQTLRQAAETAQATAEQNLATANATIEQLTAEVATLKQGTDLGADTRLDTDPTPLKPKTKNSLDRYADEMLSK